jgi:hypothetical protein
VQEKCENDLRRTQTAQRTADARAQRTEAERTQTGGANGPGDRRRPGPDDPTQRTQHCPSKPGQPFSTVRPSHWMCTRRGGPGDPPAAKARRPREMKDCSLDAKALRRARGPPSSKGPETQTDMVRSVSTECLVRRARSFGIWWIRHLHGQRRKERCLPRWLPKEPPTHLIALFG